MQTRTHYSKAPITEAIIDLRVILPRETSVEQIAEIYPQIEREFPQKDPLQTSTFTLQPGPSLNVSAGHQQIGVQLTSADKIRVLQASLEGFTFNHLTPYDSWEAFYNEAKSLWDVYRSVCMT